jgi:AcrR family transcriptional regulator
VARRRGATRSSSATARLSRDTLIDAAVALADREGLEALTIRRLAAELGVTPMALYWHVHDKDELLAALRERMIAEIELPPPREPEAWAEELRQVLEATLRSLVRHLALAPLALPGVVDSEPGLVLAERVLGLLERAGFSQQQTAQLGAYLLSSIVTIVTAQPGAHIPSDPAEQEQHLARMHAELAALPAERFPTVTRLAEAMVSKDPDRYFELGLDVLVLGLKGLAPRNANPDPSRA